MTKYIGIDPGAKGYLCLLDSTTGTAEFHMTPNEKITPYNVVNWLHIKNANDTIRIIMLEDVTSIRGASAGSNFKFGFNVGVIRGIAEGSGIGVDLVRPKVWQKTVGVPAKPVHIKKAIAEVAQRLYPSVVLYGPKGGLIDGKADALMIAHYTALKYGGIK